MRAVVASLCAAITIRGALRSLTTALVFPLLAVNNDVQGRVCAVAAVAFRGRLPIDGV